MTRMIALFAAAALALPPGLANARPLIALAVPGVAAPRLDGDLRVGGLRVGDGFETAQARGEIPLPALIRMMERRTGGQFVNANPTDGPGGRPAYWMRFRFEGGRFADYVVDAQTGQILSGG